MKKAIWKIRVTDTSETSKFAAEEFARLMRLMDTACEVSTEAAVTSEDSAETVCSDRSSNREALEIGVAKEADSSEDRIAVCVKNCTGSIWGSNPRSVLIAVYRFFKECGCGFVRPGRDGEFIPKKDSYDLEVTVSETASYQHRGICMEGCVSYENMVDTIDWAPKVGMNSYFTQFFTPYTFFDRWYRHEGNPYLTPAPVSLQTVDGFVADYTAELNKRGMRQHGVGHGWTAAVLDLPGLGWETEKDDSVPADKEMLVAMIGGKRKLWNRISLNTNLCYSSPRVKELLLEKVVDYAMKHPDIDYLHFWLADDGNNHCECENCQKAIPSDFYVDILNAMDEALTEKGLDTKIVFLLYNELKWAPEKEKIKNQDRFTLMFAPISRTYTEALNKDAKGSMLPYVRNQIQNPKSVGDSLEYLRAWQQMFKGDSFIFDYHYMWDHYKDPGYYRMAQVLNEDIENLHSIGLNGYISCQIQRVFMPNGLGMHMMGTTLWSGKTDFETEASDYFKKAYGEDGELCRAYFENLSVLFDPPALRGEKKLTGNAAQYREIPDVIDAFAPVIQRNLQAENVCQKRSWEVLDFHGQLCRKLSSMLAEVADENYDKAARIWKEVRDFVCMNELKYQSVLDARAFLDIWEYQIVDIWKQ